MATASPLVHPERPPWQTQPSARPIILRFWHFWTPSLLRPAIERFETAHPGVRVIDLQLNWGTGFDKLVLALATGNGPDVFEVGSSWMGRLMSAGVLADLTPWLPDLARTHHLWPTVTWFSDAPRATVPTSPDLAAPASHTVQRGHPSAGRVYGLPWLVSTRALYYNRRLFRAAGLDPDHPPRSWAELTAAAAAIHRPEAGVYGIGLNAGERHVAYKKFLPLVWGNGGSILNVDGSFAFADQPVQEALTFFVSLRQFALLDRQDLLDDAFARERLGMTISGSWPLVTWPRQHPGLDFGIAPLPGRVADAPPSPSFGGGQILTVNAAGPHPALAARFIIALAAETAAPIAKKTGVHLPAACAAMADASSDDPRQLVFIRQLTDAIHPPVHPGWITLEDIIDRAVERALHGMPVPATLEQARREWHARRPAARQPARSIEPPWGLGEVRTAPIASAEPGATDAGRGMAPLHCAKLTFGAAIRAATGHNRLSWATALGSEFAEGVDLSGDLGPTSDREFIRAGSAPGPSRATAARSGSTRWWTGVLLGGFVAGLAWLARRTGDWPWWALAPWLITFIVFWLYPLAWTLAISCSDGDLLAPDAWHQVGLDHYRRLAADPQFRQALGNTLLLMLVTVPVTTAIALGLAVSLDGAGAGEGRLRSAFFAPSLLSVAVAATVFRGLYAPGGPVTTSLRAVGLPAHAWLSEPSTALIAVMLLQIWVAIGTDLVLFLAGLRLIPPERYEAAAIDGAGPWQRFRHITLPGLRPMTSLVVFINVIRSWQTFTEVFVLTRGGPVGATDTICHRLYETAFRFHQIGPAAAMTVVLMIGIAAVGAVSRLRRWRDPDPVRPESR